MYPHIPLYSLHYGRVLLYAICNNIEASVFPVSLHDECNHESTYYSYLTLFYLGFEFSGRSEHINSVGYTVQSRGLSSVSIQFSAFNKYNS